MNGGKMKLQINEKAIAICKRNYKDNCGRCPIRMACIATVGIGQEGLNEWVRKVNEAAEKIV